VQDVLRLENGVQHIRLALLITLYISPDLTDREVGGDIRRRLTCENEIRKEVNSDKQVEISGGIEAGGVKRI